MPRLSTIAFDADDTLWANEAFFQDTQERFRALLADYAEPKGLSERLFAAEKRNLGHYGFGVKGFTLSMIETAIEATEGRVPASVIGEILAAGRAMMSHPIELLPHAREAVSALSGRYRLLLITKGDLFHQERKLAQSGLGELFDGVEIVSDKTPGIYARIFARHGEAAKAMMVGNSLKSDVLPAIEAGGWGIFVPHDLTWAYETAEAPEAHARYREVPHLGHLESVIAEIEAFDI
jgi:putative hydrolase of the HAD superfamily